MSRSIGDRLFKAADPPLVPATPHTCTRQVKETDSFVLLASDGVFDVLSNLRACAVTLELEPRKALFLYISPANELVHPG